jgi:hypothetical protein
VTGTRLLGLAIVAAALILAILLMRAVLDRVPAPDPSPSIAASASPTSVLGPSATPSSAPTPSATPASSPGAIATSSPVATTDPRLAYAAFVLRLEDTGRETEPLLDDLRDAAEATDEAGVRTAAEALGVIADREREWLAANPPAACYAGAHAEADDTYAATAAAADAAIGWADATGLAKLGALVDALGAVGTATDAVEALSSTLGRVDCG